MPPRTKRKSEKPAPHRGGRAILTAAEHTLPAQPPLAVVSDDPRALKALDEVIAAMNEKFDGVGTMRRLSDPEAYDEITIVTPTGLPALDAAIGVGGLPSGKIIEIYGKEHSCKTSLAKWIAGRAQSYAIWVKTGELVGRMTAAVIDTEQSGAGEYDAGLGMHKETTAVTQDLDTMEQVIDFLYTAIPIFERRKVPCLFIWDSLAGTPMKAELESEVDDEQRMALRAGFLSKHVRNLVKKLKTGLVGLIIVNQLREKIGAMQFEKKTYSPGGRALKHFAHLRMEMTTTGQLKKGDVVVGLKVKVIIAKNKMAPPYRTAEVEFYFDPMRFVDPSVAAAQQPKPRRQAVRLTDTAAEVLE